MADIITYQSRPGGLEAFTQNLLGGAGQALGQGAVKGLGSLMGLGAEKLGITGPSKEQIDFMVNKYGMTPEEALAFYKLDPRAQQQEMSNFGTKQQKQRRAERYGATPKQSPRADAQMQPEGEMGEEDAQNNIIRMLLEGNVAEDELKTFLDDFTSKKSGDEKEQFTFRQTPSERFRELVADGEDPKIAKQDVEVYRPEYKELADAEKEFTKSALKDLESSDAVKNRFMKIYNMGAEGELPTPQTVALTRVLEKTLGMNEGDLGWILGAPAEEVGKLLSDTIKDAKSVFGGRITDADLAAWFKRLPSLLQSDEGKLRAINDIMIFEDLKALRGKAVKEILAETGGKIPDNIERIVDKRIEKERDKLTQMFIEGKSNIPDFEKTLAKVSKKSKREASAGKAGGVAGATLGGLGGAALGRAAGGILGSVAGPLGAGAGVLGGGYIGSKLGGAGGAAAGAEIANLLANLNVNEPPIQPYEGSMRNTLEDIYG